LPDLGVRHGNHPTARPITKPNEMTATVARRISIASLGGLSNGEVMSHPAGAAAVSTPRFERGFSILAPPGRRGAVRAAV